MHKSMRISNKSQIIGLGIALFGIGLYLFVENGITDAISGASCAIGLAFILNWIPFHKKKLK